MTEIEKLTAGHPDTQSADIVAGNIEALRTLFPEAFTEGKIDFEVLKQCLGGAVDEREEKYGLNWHGKRRARQIALTPSTGTLLPCHEDSVDWDTTQNLMIEGDNLEVLKLLQKSYAGKVKLIYIDPPYNTGKDFVYPDDFRDGIKNYLEITGQIEGGKRVSSNVEASGRFHTDWLNMIFPRLKLARGLLSDDGVVFVSIDENEVTNLKVVLSEIFGPENIIATIANINNPKGRSDDKFIATAHEYIMVVAKNASTAKMHGFEPEEHITKRYGKRDKDNRVYREIDLRKTGDEDLRTDRPDMFYFFYFHEESGKLRVSKGQSGVAGEREIIPLREDGAEGRWRWGFDTAEKQLSTLTARYMPNRKIWGIFEKDFLDGRPPVKATSSWTFKDVNSERGSEQLIEMGFDKETFPRPKPLGTMRRVIEVGTVPYQPSIILDFFAGSGGLMHAAVNLVAEGERDLRFIAVQLPEPTRQQKDDGSWEEAVAWKQGFTNIAEITKERLRRVGKEIRADNPMYNGDVGFRVYKLASSNISPWEPIESDLAGTLLAHAEHLVPGRSEADILTELLLKLGLDLCVPIKTKDIAGKSIHAVGAGALIVCLSDGITREVVEGLAQGIVAWWQALAPAGDTRVVFKDSAFADDVAKTNMAAILNQAGIKDMRSL
jgi:adenine-specific DNA-methyltransferase